MNDRILEAFLSRAARDAAQVNRDSDTVRLVPIPADPSPPDTYLALFSGIEHLERSSDGTVHASDGDIVCRISFPEDYLRAIDETLQFRVVGVPVSLIHPNVRAGLVCLGPDFRPGTRLRSLLDHVYQRLTCRVAAPEHAFDTFAAQYWMAHAEEVRALRARPLWRRRLARRVRVEDRRREGSPGA